MSRASTLRRQAFVREFLIDHNGTQAAIRAGYTPKSAASEAHRLLRNAKIWAAVEQAARERAERVGLTADQVLAELKAIGLSRMRRISSWGPDGVRLTPSAELTDADDAAIQEITETDKRTHVKLFDKVAALRLASIHLGLGSDDRETRPIVYLDDVMLRKAAR